MAKRFRKEYWRKARYLHMKKRLAKYGNLTKHHQKINSEYSTITYTSMQKSPGEFFEYHRNI